MKKVAILLWPLSDMGGVVTFIEEMRYGFRKLGVGCTVGLLGRSSDGIEKLMNCNGRVLAGGIIRYNYRDPHSELYKMLKGCGLAIYMTTCPRKTKKTPPFKEWSHIYRRVGQMCPSIAIMHDQYWKTNYPWIADLADDLKAIVVVKEPDEYTLIKEEFPALDLMHFIHWPLRITKKHRKIMEGKLGKRSIFIVSMSRWKTCKHVPDVLKIARHLKRPLTVHFYGNGIQYYQYKRGDYFGDKRDELWNKVFGTKGHELSRHQYMGVAKTRQEVDDVYTYADALIDLSRRRGCPGMYNYTSTECMRFGVVPIMADQVRASMYPHIMDRADVIVVPQVTSGIRPAMVIERYMNDVKHFDEMRLHNFEFVKEYFEARQQCEKFLKFGDF